MLKSELEQIIANGENSGVEFKRDDCRPNNWPEKSWPWSISMAGLSCSVLKMTARSAESSARTLKNGLWTCSRQKIHPLILPFYEEIQINDQKRVAMISFMQGIAKPKKGVTDTTTGKTYHIRVGSTSRLATREQQARLFASGGGITSHRVIAVFRNHH